MKNDAGTLVIQKRDGQLQEWNHHKVIAACKASGASSRLATNIARGVHAEIHNEDVLITVNDLHELVISELREYGPSGKALARSYGAYKAERDRLRQDRVRPHPTAISDYIVASKYSKWRGEEGLETWKDTCYRNLQMHLDRFTDEKICEELRQVYELFVIPKKVLPAMRSLQFGGKAIEVNNTRMYNCWFGKVDSERFFSKLFFILLSGGGVGYSVQQHHIAQLPPVKHVSREQVHHHAIEDTIEGWATSVDVLMESYFRTGTYVEFIYCAIRNKGSWLQTSGGRAPGHVPLKIALEAIRAILEAAQGRQLTDFEAHRIACLEALAVLAGGIRRSSLIALFSHSSQEMFYCKTDSWFDQYPELAMANNSVVFKRDVVTREQFIQVFEACRHYGEPGFFFTEDLEYGTNPCGEIGLHPVQQGSLQACNLVETNCSTVTSKEDFWQRCEAAAFIGTLQADYTDFDFLGKATEEVVEGESLIGVGLTGIMASSICRDEATLREGARIVNATNARVAKLLGINPAARTTTLKPSGTASLVLTVIVSCPSGVHTEPARRYLRLVTANEQEPVFQHFKKKNPHMCQQKPNGDWVITFPIEVDTLALTTKDFTAVQFMDEVFRIYDAWILPGTVREEVSPGLTHNISCTVTVKPDEWDAVAEHAWNNRHRIAAQSYMPDDGDTKYPFAPRQPIRTEADEAQWNTLLQLYTPVDYTEITTFDGQRDIGAACEGGRCEL